MIVDPARQELDEVETKAVKMVAEGRVHVRWVERRGRAADGVVDGENDTYLSWFSPAGRGCTCMAGSHHQRCSHAIALQLRVAAGDYLQLELI